jgi:hypothetical protein
MTFSVTSPITGGAQTGFTSPTYTVTTDTAPEFNGKQWAVTALGGTQVGVLAHSVAAPFTITVTRPKVFRVLGKPNPTTGLVKDVPMNVYTVLVRKGVLPLAAQPYATAMIKCSISIPAGSDTADPSNLRAALSALVGVLTQQSAGVGDTVVSGILG